MTDAQKVDAYIKKHARWRVQLGEIRNLFLQTVLVEEIKWGTPSYSLNGKLVAGVAAFKNHMGIWFHQGVFLTDSERKLMNAQEGKTKALRQWRFDHDDTIDHALILQYITEAIENCLAGKEIKPERKKGVSIDTFLRHALDENSEFQKYFKTLTPGKQREYAEYISEAKRETTKQNRLEKIIPMVIEGVGLNDKYKSR